MQLITTICPVYNSEKYLSKCLDSLVNQTYSNIEIICINDGSTDNSLQILEEYARKDERIKIINQENQGVSVARNNGIDNATGDYILFVDADDWIETDTCEKIIKNLTHDIDILFFGYKNIKNNRIQQSFYYNFGKDIYNFPKDLIYNINNLNYRSIWGKIYKLSYIKKYNIKFPVDSAFGEDTYFIINNIIHDCKIKIINDTLYNYRIDTSNSLTKINLKKQLDSLILLLNKLNDLFVENNVDKTLQLKICDDTYWFMFLLWNLYYSKYKKTYLEAIKNAKLFYSQYPVEELIKLKGYKRLQQYLSLQKYHVMWLYLNLLRPIGKYCVVLPYRRFKAKKQIKN